MSTGTVGWFCALGLPLSDSERRQAAAYADALGVLPRVEAVLGWAEAESLLRRAVPDDGGRCAEEAERMRLMGSLTERLGPAALLATLADAGQGAAEAIRTSAARAAARTGAPDSALVEAAIGAAAQSVQLAILAELAAAPASHPFRLKHALFSAGRWPLGVFGGRLTLF